MSSASSSACSTSGVVRTSTHTDAPAGITFICAGSPARRTVGVIHTCPRRGCSPKRSCRDRSRSARAPIAWPTARFGLRPWNGIAPWAILPVRSMRNRSAPLATAQISPPSGSQQITASTPSARPRATKSLAPSIIPSSSTRAASTTRPGNGPLRRRASVAKSIAARPPFMSAEPRPHRRPSTTSPLNGSNVQPSPSVTTSVCPSNISVGPGPPPPSTVATTLGRPAATTSISGSHPNARICWATRSAAAARRARAPGRGRWGCARAAG